MADNNFAVQFTIAAGLAAGFTGAFQKARAAFTGLDKETKQLQQAQRELDNQIKQAQATMANYAGPTAQAREQLRGLRKEMLANAQAQMSQAKQGMMNGAQQVVMGVGAAAMFSEPIRDAMKFESSMADVRKVVDGLDESAFKGMSNEILKMSTEIPMTAEGIAQIVAAGGQSGIARNELLDFAKDASKMGIAFDVTADQAGDMMAKWRTAFKMGQTDVVTLADKINYLGNTTAAGAPLIADVVTRIGPLGAVGGVASGEIAALGASMIGTGVQSEVAATGIKNLILGMTAGAGATEGQADAFAKLGLDAVDMSKKMQVDAKGAILEVMKAIQGLSADEQANVLKDLFGKESIGAIAPLLSNLDALQDNFNKVADKAQYAGSMEQEYITRCQTAENATQLFKNATEAISISMGQALLPILKDGAIGLVGFAQGAAEFIQEHPNLVSAIGLATGAIIGLYIASGIATIVMNAYRFACAAGTFAMTAFKLATSSSTYALIANKATMIATRIAHFAFGMVLITLRGAMMLATAAQWAFNAALSANPIGLVIIAIVALIAIGVSLYTYWDTVKAFFISLWESPMAAVFAFIGGPITMLLYLGSLLIANWDAVKAWFTLLWEDPKAAIGQLYDFVINKFGEMYNYLAEKWASIKEIFAHPIDAVVNFVKGGDSSAQSAAMAQTGAIPGFAIGGRVTRPTMALVGEGGDEEYIVPINSSSRSRQLWQEAGSKLGMLGKSEKSNNFAGKAQGLTSSVAKTNNSSSSSIAPQYVFAPTINVANSSVKEGINDALRSGLKEFKSLAEQLAHENRRVSLE